MNSTIRTALTGTYEYCFPFAEGIKTPFLKYRAIGYELCERCLVLDGLCLDRKEALEIERSLTCECPHVWDSYAAVNNFGRDNETTKAGWSVGLSMSLVPCASLCPAELFSLAQEALVAADAFQLEHKRINKMINAPDRTDINPCEVMYCHNVRQNEAVPYVEARRRNDRAHRAVSNYIENLVRDAHGLPHVGEGWVNETRLFRIVEEIFQGREVVHHYRAPWLGRLELDVYVPSVNIAFEYQGIQHFEPQEHWGGEQALEMTAKRDAEKRERCKAHNTLLIEIYYDEELSADLVRKKLTGMG